MASRGVYASARPSPKRKRYYCSEIGCPSSAHGGFARSYERNRHCATSGHGSEAKGGGWKFYVCDACPKRTVFPRLDKFKLHARHHPDKNLTELVRRSVTRSPQEPHKVPLRASDFSRCEGTPQQSQAHEESADTVQSIEDFEDKRNHSTVHLHSHAESAFAAWQSSVALTQESDASTYQSPCLVETLAPTKHYAPTTPRSQQNNHQRPQRRGSGASAGHKKTAQSPKLTTNAGTGSQVLEHSDCRSPSTGDPALRFPCVWDDALGHRNRTPTCYKKESYVSRLGKHFDSKHEFRCCTTCFREDFVSLDAVIVHRRATADQQSAVGLEDCAFRCVTKGCWNDREEPTYRSPCGHGQQHPGHPERTPKCNQFGCGNFDQLPSYAEPCRHRHRNGNSQRDIWRECYRLQRRRIADDALPFPETEDVSSPRQGGLVPVQSPQPQVGSPDITSLHHGASIYTLENVAPPLNERHSPAPAQLPVLDDQISSASRNADGGNMAFRPWASNFGPQNVMLPLPAAQNPWLTQVPLLQAQVAGLRSLASSLRRLIMSPHPTWTPTTRQDFESMILLLTPRTSTGHNQVDYLAARATRLEIFIQHLSTLIEFPASRTHNMWMVTLIMTNELLDDPEIGVDWSQEMPWIPLSNTQALLTQQDINNPAGEGPSHMATWPDQQPFSHAPFLPSIDGMMSGNRSDAMPSAGPVQQFSNGSADFTREDVEMQDEEPPYSFPNAPG